MHMFRYFLLAAIVASPGVAATSAIYALQFFNRVDELPKRMPQVDSVGGYTQSLNAVLQTHLDFAGTKKPCLASVVIAIAPSGRSRAWLLGFEEALPSEHLARLTSMLEAIRAPRVVGGPVAFFLRLSLWDAQAPKQPDPRAIPFPDEWKELFKGKVGGISIPDDLPPQVWTKKQRA